MEITKDNTPQPKPLSFVEESPGCPSNYDDYLFVESSRNGKQTSFDSQRRAHVQRDRWRQQRAYIKNESLEISHSSSEVTQGSGEFDSHTGHLMREISSALESHLLSISPLNLEETLKTFFTTNGHPLHVPRPFLISYAEWIKSTVTADSVAVNALLSYCGLLMKAQHARPIDDWWIHCKVKALNSLRPKLETMHHSSASTIFSVMCLAGCELLEQGLPAAQIHIDGLRAIRKSRGGFGELPSWFQDMAARFCDDMTSSETWKIR